MQSDQLVSDESPDLKIEDFGAEGDEAIANFKGRSYSALTIAISSVLPEDSEVDSEKLSQLVAMLTDLSASNNPNIIDTCNIIYSGSQEAEGIVPTMILCPVEAKRFKTLREVIPCLSQVGFPEAMRDIARLLQMLHAKNLCHGNLSADRIFYNENSKCYCVHPIDLVNSFIKIKFTSEDGEDDCNAKEDVFHFANCFRKLFLDFPDISSLIKCTITYILDDCLHADSSRRPTAERIASALEGILLGFNSMQSEIEKMRKHVAVVEEERNSAVAALAAANAGKSAQFGEGTPSNPSPTSKASSMRWISSAPSKSQLQSPAVGAAPMPINAVHEKRANTGSFSRALQVFKSKLKDGIHALVWEPQTEIEAYDVMLNIEGDRYLVFIPPVASRLYSLISGRPSVPNVDFAHVIECWAGAPPHVLGEGMNNDLTFLTILVDNERETRQLSLMFENMEERDDLLMGFRNMVAMSSMVTSGSSDLKEQLCETGSYLNADMNQDSFADLYASSEENVVGESEYVSMSSFASPTKSENQVDMMDNPMARFRNKGGNDIPKLSLQQSSPRSLPKPKKRSEG